MNSLQENLQGKSQQQMRRRKGGGGPPVRGEGGTKRGQQQELTLNPRFEKKESLGRGNYLRGKVLLGCSSLLAVSRQRVGEKKAPRWCGETSFEKEKRSGGRGELKRES